MVLPTVTRPAMYLIRSKGPINRIRDGKTGEMRVVGPREWIVFDVLPRGMTVAGSPTSEIREVKCDADLESAIEENKRMADEDAVRFDAPRPAVREAKPAPMELEMTPSEPQPQKPRRGRPRG